MLLLPLCSAQGVTIVVGENGGSPDAGAGATNPNFDGATRFYVSTLNGITVGGNSNGVGSNTFTGANVNVSFTAAGSDLLFRDVGGTVYAEFAASLNEPGNVDSFFLNALSITFSGGTIYQLPVTDNVQFFEVDTTPGDPFDPGTNVLFNDGSQVRAAILVPLSNFTALGFTQSDTLTFAANFTTENANDKVGVTNDGAVIVPGRVSNPLTIPEPSGVSLVLAFAGWILGRRSRRGSL